MSDFSAKEPALGYLYQARYALWLLLDGDEEKGLVLESLDDIVLETDGAPRDLLQTKHHINQQARLTDSSPDLWKTLRIWSTHFQDRRIDVGVTRLSLITTASAPANSVAAFLRADGQRDCRAAQQRLLSIATSSANAHLEPSFAAFVALAEDDQLALLQAMFVIDNSPGILDVGDHIRRRIRAAVTREHREAVFERLEGWWMAKVIEHLRASAPQPVSGFEVYDKLAAIAEQFRPDALPIDFLDARPETIDPHGDNRLFVHQLRMIDLGKTRIEKAIIDYYRAFEQRSRWAREDLVVGGEMETYEERLVDEWQRLSAAITDEIPRDSQESYLRKTGRDIFNWMELTADIRIRPSVTEPYVMRGSYHILANKPEPTVWWHPRFMERVAAVIGIGKEV